MKLTGKTLINIRMILSIITALALVPVIAIVFRYSGPDSPPAMVGVVIAAGLSILQFALTYTEKQAVKKHEQEEEHKEKQALIDKVKELEEKISQTEE